MIMIARAIWRMGIMLCSEMNGEVYGAHDNGCQEERRNGLYCNAPMEKVNVICEDRKDIQDDCVHDDDAETERDHDDGSEDECEERLQEKVEDCKDEADHDELPNIGAQDKSGHPAIGKPQRKSVAEDDDRDLCEPVHIPLMISNKPVEKASACHFFRFFDAHDLKQRRRG